MEQKIALIKNNLNGPSFTKNIAPKTVKKKAKIMERIVCNLINFFIII